MIKLPIPALPVPALVDVEQRNMALVPVMFIVNMQKTVVLTLNKNAPMSTLLHTSVTQMTMLLTMKQNADHVREDVILGVSHIISVFAGLSVDTMESAVKISRWHVQMSTDNSYLVSVGVVIWTTIISAIVIVNVEDRINAVKISRQHVRKNTNNSFPNYVIHMMMFQTITQNASLARTDVVIRVPIVVSVIATLTVEEAMILLQRFPDCMSR